MPNDGHGSNTEEIKVTKMIQLLLKADVARDTRDFLFGPTAAIAVCNLAHACTTNKPLDT